MPWVRGYLLAFLGVHVLTTCEREIWGLVEVEVSGNPEPRIILSMWAGFVTSAGAQSIM